MAERELGRNSDAVALRHRAPPVVWTRADRFRERLDRSKLRLREAVVMVKESARDMTPAARIESNPIAWVAGGLAFGLLLGWVTAPSRRRHRD